MRRFASCSIFLLLVSTACSSGRGPGTPILMPAPPVPAPTLPTKGPWSFNYASGTASYRIVRSAAIESRSAANTQREVSTNATHELLTFQVAGDTIHFTAVVDTFSTTTQGLIGPVQEVQLPAELAGSLVGDSLILSTDTLSNRCNPVRSAIATDVHNLIARFPAQLSVGTSWKDSVDSRGCQGTISTTSHTIRSYTVSGETEYQGSTVLLIQRTDVINAQGEGAQQQHRIILDANGTGNAVYYLNPRDGYVVRLIVGQDLNLTITASGQSNRFKQSSKQDFSLVR